jgi:hypothetical protein
MESSSRKRKRTDSLADLELLKIFGRFADHLAVGNCVYTADTEVPFSLWITSKFSRRLKNQHPQWEPLFEGGNAIPRAEFHTRLQALPFKYPLGVGSTPADIPSELVDDIDGEITCSLLRSDESLRLRVNSHIDKQPICAKVVDAVFDALLAPNKKGAEGTISQAWFELKLVEWASDDPETEPDPVVEWGVFRQNVLSHGNNA